MGARVVPVSLRVFTLLARRLARPSREDRRTARGYPMLNAGSRFKEGGGTGSREADVTSWIEVHARKLNQLWDPGNSPATGGYPIVLEFFLETPEAVDAKFNELVAFGCRPYLEPYDTPINTYFAMIDDPDGNAILLSAGEGVWRRYMTPTASGVIEVSCSRSNIAGCGYHAGQRETHACRQSRRATSPVFFCGETHRKVGTISPQQQHPTVAWRLRA